MTDIKQYTTRTNMLWVQPDGAGGALTPLACADLDELSDIGSSLSPGKKVRLFAGYAGWSPGQLEDEVRRSAWLTHPATIDLVFDNTPAELWKNILRAKGGYYRMLATMPDDLSVN